MPCEIGANPFPCFDGIYTYYPSCCNVSSTHLLISACLLVSKPGKLIPTLRPLHLLFLLPRLLFHHSLFPSSLLKCHQIRKLFLTTYMELHLPLPLDVCTSFLCCVFVFIHFSPSDMVRICLFISCPLS